MPEDPTIELPALPEMVEPVASELKPPELEEATLEPTLEPTTDEAPLDVALLAPLIAVFSTDLPLPVVLDLFLSFRYPMNL